MMNFAAEVKVIGDVCRSNFKVHIRQSVRGYETVDHEVMVVMTDSPMLKVANQ